MTTNTPRLYLDHALTPQQAVPLDKAQAHYLTNVMRLAVGASVRIFNGRDGEWAAQLSDQRTLTAQQQLRPQGERPMAIHLYFSPLKKDRTHMLVEKTTELGVTDLHPIICDHTNAPSFRAEKTTAHIIEAAEQCERLSIPTLHPVQKLSQLPLTSDFQVAMERMQGTDCKGFTATPHILIGPEGGWSDSEKSRFQSEGVPSLTLGPNILRAETAAITALARLV